MLNSGEELGEEEFGRILLIFHFTPFGLIETL